MKRGTATWAATALVVIAACDGGDAATIGQSKRLVVTIMSGDTGQPGRTLPVSVVTPTTYTVNVEAQLPDGTTDTSFNGYVQLSVQPGTITDLSVRNLQLQNGVLPKNADGSTGKPLPIVGAFGDAHIWAQDLGYEPADPARMPPPQCSDGLDNNNNGLKDYPADPGCFAPVDDSEDTGSYATGVSPTLYFSYPRISYVRGYDPANAGDGNATYFPEEQVTLDTGWRGGSDYAFSTVVVGLTSAGFYAQDLQDDQHPGPGYGGIYAYNFATPPDMRVCDRVQILSGTSADFYGFTELNYPTWQLEYWDPRERPCLVPEPVALGVGDLTNDSRLWQLEANLVRVQSVGTVSVHVAGHFGPGFVPLVGGTYTPNATASNCDFNQNGKVDYTDPTETACADACNGTSSSPPTDPECSEWSQYASEAGFVLILTDSASGSSARIQGDASGANFFDPPSSRGKQLVAFTGVISYFSGGTQFTINARCEDDVVSTPGALPLTSDVACVHPRCAIGQTNCNVNSQ